MHESHSMARYTYIWPGIRTRLRIDELVERFAADHQHRIADVRRIDQPVDGLLRELAAGVTTRIFSGEHAMLSVVTCAPNTQGMLHQHPEKTECKRAHNRNELTHVSLVR